jgi:hypothetical protein
VPRTATIGFDDLISWHAAVDSEGRSLEGRWDYCLHFAPCQEPPARGFWSIAVFDDRGLPVDNRLRRFSIGDRNELEFDEKGSLDILVCRELLPPARSTNWLPAPATPFVLVMQIYGPLPAALNGAWRQPPVRRLEPSS